MDTRIAILDEAQRLIQTRGLNGMSYDDIAVTVGIRKPSIHHHFRTKADLTLAVIDRYAENFGECVDEIESTQMIGADQLAAYANLFEATLRQGRGKAVCLCGMLASEIATLDDDSSAAIRKFYRRATAALVRILRRGIEDESLLLDGEPEPVAEMVFSLFQGTLVTCRVSGGPKRFRQTTQQLLQLFLA